MHFMPLDIDSREGTRRTDILTGSAADAGSIVDGGNHGRLLAIGIQRHHLNGSRGTMAGTVAALHLISQHHAVLLDPHGVTYLDGRLLIFIDGLDSTSRADLRTARTLRTTMAPLIGHLWQHQVHQVARRTEHIVRTLRDTELTARAMLGKMVKRERSWRRQRCLPLRLNFVLQFRQTAIHQFLFLLSHRCRRHQCRSHEERALTAVNGIGLYGLTRTIFSVRDSPS